MDQDSDPVMESYTKPNTKRNNSTYKLARGCLQVANNTSNRKWSKHRFASYRNDLKSYVRGDQHQNQNIPCSKTGSSRDIWDSPKDSLGSNGLLSRHEIESLGAISNQSKQITYRYCRYNIIAEKRVIRALKHGHKKVSYLMQ